MSTTSVEWYAIYTRSRYEQRVADSLTSRALDVFLPKVKVLSRRRDRRKVIEIPLFSSYLFVHALLNPDIRLAIQKTPGVVRILGHDREPRPVPAEEVESLLTIVQSGREIQPFAYLREGMKVRVKSGPLRDAVGFLVEKQERKQRLIVSVHLMNQSVSVSLDACDVDPYN
jgi:transcription antitermination factor NusG